LRPDESFDSWAAGGDRTVKKPILETILAGFLVALAIYVFFAMIFSIDFTGMGFSEIKLVLSVCLGVAVSIVCGAKGVQMIQSALTGFVTGAVLFALVEWAFQNL
jgi:prepilin signal peptidase PulO-like enzyme (type II secretory pathway)